MELIIKLSKWAAIGLAVWIILTITVMTAYFLLTKLKIGEDHVCYSDDSTC